MRALALERGGTYLERFGFELDPTRNDDADQKLTNGFVTFFICCFCDHPQVSKNIILTNLNTPPQSAFRTQPTIME